MKFFIPISGYRTPMKTMEFAGRTCYSSYPKIEEGSAAKFIGGIVRSGHESVIEHSRLVTRLAPGLAGLRHFIAEMIASTGVCLVMSVIGEDPDADVIISGNFRAWRDAVREMRDHGGSTGVDVAGAIEEMLGEIDPILAEGLKCL